MSGGTHDAAAASSETIDLVIVPGVGFDEQLVAEVPREPQDRPLDAVLTPGGVYRRS